MATIEQLERKIEQLENQLQTQMDETRQLIEKSEKALDWAKHSYRVDHYGFIWAWDVNAQKYRKSNMRVCSPEIITMSITGDKLAPGAVTGDKIAPNAITKDKIAPGTLDGKYVLADLNLLDLYIEENGDIVADLDETIIPGEFIDREVTTDEIKDGTIQKEDLNEELQEEIERGGAPDATEEDLNEIINY